MQHQHYSHITASAWATPFQQSKVCWCRELFFSAFNSEQLQMYPEPFKVLCHLVGTGHQAVTQPARDQVSHRAFQWTEAERAMRLLTLCDALSS